MPTPSAAGPTVAGVAAALPGELVGVLSWIVADEIDSTQTLARKLLDRHFADGEQPRPFVVLALAQTAGRGRRGRPWSSARGLGVWASLALPVADSRHLQSLPLRAAVALGETANRWLDGRCRVKWPNDLLCDGRKIGGLLIDAIAGPEGAGWAVVGVGFNHGHRAGELPEERATSLALAADEPPPLPTVSGGLLEAVWREMATPRDWRARYEALSVHRPGDRIECETASGERVAGAFAGFDELGRIRIDAGEAVRTISSGEVFS